MRRTEEDMTKSLNALVRCLASPRTMDDLTARFDVHRTTMWAWFKQLDEQGSPVVRVNRGRPEKYRMAG